jgi:sec-independent protein translocase protein TatC
MASYVSFACLFMILFGIVFQLPLVMLVLARLGFVKGSQLASSRKYVLLLCFLVGALLTPPDVFSQTLMAIPVMLLFEASIWLVRISESLRRKKQQEEEGKPVDDDEPS